MLFRSKSVAAIVYRRHLAFCARNPMKETLKNELRQIMSGIFFIFLCVTRLLP
jgi:hypothetical protein